jgi:hypothetical protein
MGEIRTVIINLNSTDLLLDKLILKVGNKEIHISSLHNEIYHASVLVDGMLTQLEECADFPQDLIIKILDTK